MLLRSHRIVFGVLLAVALFLSSTSENRVSGNTVPRLIVISFDGFRPDYVDPIQTPNMYKLAKSGVFGAHMKSRFGTKTFPNHMSIATGFYEETHGIVHNHMFDPVFNATFTWNNTETRWWDNNISLPIWVANQRGNDGKVRFSGGMMWPGVDVKIRGELPHYILKYDHDHNWTKSVDTVFSWLLHKTAPANLVVMYFDQPDAEAHLFGPWSKEVRLEILRADKIIGYITSKLEDAELYDDTNIIVLSDHGMSEIKPDRIILLDKFLNRTLYDLHGASPLWNILPKPGQEDHVFSVLQNASKSNHFSVYKKEDPVLEAYHYQNNRRILPIVIVADDEYDLVDSMNTLGEEKNHPRWGNHGYNNSLPSMRPLFMARGPAFRENLNYTEPFQNVDVFPLMCYVLQLLPLSQFPSNGSLSRVAEMVHPITRTASSENMLPVLMVFIVGFLIICLGGTCLVAIAGYSKPRKSVEVNWDGGTTDFNLPEPEHSRAKAIMNKNLLSKAYYAQEEAVLLLETDEEL